MALLALDLDRTLVGDGRLLAEAWHCLVGTAPVRHADPDVVHAFLQTMRTPFLRGGTLQLLAAAERRRDRVCLYSRGGVTWVCLVAFLLAKAVDASRSPAPPAPPAPPTAPPHARPFHVILAAPVGDDAPPSAPAPARGLADRFGLRGCRVLLVDPAPRKTARHVRAAFRRAASARVTAVDDAPWAWDVDAGTRLVGCPPHDYLGVVLPPLFGPPFAREARRTRLMWLAHAWEEELRDDPPAAPDAPAAADAPDPPDAQDPSFDEVRAAVYELTRRAIWLAGSPPRETFDLGTLLGPGDGGIGGVSGSRRPSSSVPAGTAA